MPTHSSGNFQLISRLLCLQASQCNLVAQGPLTGLTETELMIIADRNEGL